MESKAYKTEIKQIEAYYLRKHKETGHTDFLYDDGKPFKNLMIEENADGRLFATCEIRFVWYLNAWDKSVVLEDTLIKLQDGNWVSRAFNYNV